MHLPLTPAELLSVRLAAMRLDIGTRLQVVTKDMHPGACVVLIESMSRLQYAGEQQVIRDAAADTDRALGRSRANRLSA